MSSGYLGDVSNDEPDLDRIAARVSDVATSTGRTVAVAESLTGGLLSSALAAAGGSGRWYRGAVVAYASGVKHDVLGVPDGPVVDAGAAQVMAEQARKLLGADVAVALTGVGGPDPQDGHEPGTVFIAIADGATDDVVRREFPGEPGDVCAGCAAAALRFLAERLEQ